MLGSMREIDEELFEACETWGVSPAKVRRLLAKGASPNAKDDERKTPLHAAAESNVAALVTILLDAGAKLEAKDQDGRTPAFEWAYSGDGKGLRLLLDRGANPNAKDKDHTTPLHMAARSENLATAAILIEAGADLRARDSEQHSPEDVARSMDRLKMLKLLAKHGAADASVDLDTWAKELGAKAARSASDSGDHEYYTRESDLDPSDLPNEYWQNQYAELARGAMSNAKQKPTKKLLSKLEALFYEGYEAEMKRLAGRTGKKRKPKRRR